MASLIPLALAAAVYPSLLAGVIVLLARDKPAPLLGAFLAGGVLISVAAGLIIVFALGGVSKSDQRSASPAIDLIGGVLSLGLAGVLWKRMRDRHGAPRTAKKKKDGDSWTQRALGDGSAWVAFGAGLVLNLPGVWYLEALKDISKAKLGTAASILWILLFVAVMFVLAEVPLVGYAVNPDGTRVRVTRFRMWLSEHARTVAISAAATIGVYLTVKGIVGLV